MKFRWAEQELHNKKSFKNLEAQMTNLGIIITLKVLKFNTDAVILPNYNSRNTFSTFLYFQSISWLQVLPISLGFET